MLYASQSDQNKINGVNYNQLLCNIYSEIKSPQTNIAKCVTHHFDDSDTNKLSKQLDACLREYAVVKVSSKKISKTDSR